MIQAKWSYGQGKTKSEVLYWDTAGIENDGVQCNGQAVSTKVVFMQIRILPWSVFMHCNEQNSPISPGWSTASSTASSLWTGVLLQIIHDMVSPVLSSNQRRVPCRNSLPGPGHPCPPLPTLCWPCSRIQSIVPQQPNAALHPWCSLPSPWWCDKLRGMWIWQWADQHTILSSIRCSSLWSLNLASNGLFTSRVPWHTKWTMGGNGSHQEPQQVWLLLRWEWSPQFREPGQLGSCLWQLEEMGQCYITVGMFTQHGLGSAKQRHWVVCSGFCFEY